MGVVKIMYIFESNLPLLEQWLL